MFREIIKKRLEQMNLTQVKLADITKINKSTIASFIAGNRSISNNNIEKILTALKLTLVPIPGFKYGYGEDNKPTEPVKEGESED